MPDNNTIGINLDVTGDREYTESMKSACRELKVLRSELKAETSAFDDNTSQQQRNAVQTANLTKQLQVQQKIVQANEKRLELLKKKYGENHQEVQNFQVKLNNSKVAMNKTEAALKALARQEQDASRETKALSDDVKQLGEDGEKAGRQLSEGLLKNLEFNQAMQKFETFANFAKGALEGIANVASSVVSSVSSIVVEIAGAADDIATLSLTSGLSIETLNKLSYAARAGYDIDYRTFAQAAAKLRTSRTSSAFDPAKTTKKGKETVNTPAGLFNGLDVIANPDGTTRSATNEELMWNILRFAARTYNPNGDNTALDSAMMQAFGKSYSEFYTFLSDPAALDRIIASGVENGLVRSEDQTTELAGIQDNLDTITAIMSSIKELFVLLFGENFKDITTDYAGFLQGINDFENALLGNGDADTESAISKIQSSINKLATDLGDIISKALGYVQSAIEDISKETDENGEPTFLAKMAQGILSIEEWFNNDLPSIMTEVRDFFQTMKAIFDKIALFLGIKSREYPTYYEQYGDPSTTHAFSPDNSSNLTGYRYSDSIEDAAQKFYDLYFRHGEYANMENGEYAQWYQIGQDNLFKALGFDEQALIEFTQAMSEFNTKYGNPEDLPSEWFSSGWDAAATGDAGNATSSLTDAAGTLTSAADKVKTAVDGIPGQVSGAIANIRMYIDGQAVGRASSGYVNSALRVNIVTSGGYA